MANRGISKNAGPLLKVEEFGTKAMYRRNIGPFPIHSFSYYRLTPSSPLPPLYVSFSGNGKWVKGCFRKREESGVFSIELVIQGHMQFTQNNKLHVVGPGTVFLVHKKKTSSMEAISDLLLKRTVCLDGLLLQQAIELAGLSNIDVICIQDYHSFVQLMKEINSCMQRTDNSSMYDAAALGYKLLLLLSNSISHQDIPPALIRVINLMNAHPDGSLDRKAFATEAATSISNLHYLFRKHLGVAPQKFYERLQLEQAARLLNDSAMSIKQIALQSGFDDQLYFSKRFKKQFNMSPREWRKRQYF